MKNRIILCVCIALSINAFAQKAKGKPFPDLTGETFAGKTVNLPKDTKGKFSLIGVCFSKDAEDDLKGWLNPVYNAFVMKKDTTQFMSMAENYDAHFYFIPMLNKVNQIFEKGSKEKIRNGTDKGFWPYLLFYNGAIKPYKEDFEITDSKIPYFFVVDKSGKIVHVESGKYTAKKMSAIEDFFSEAE
ncbi:MAG: hypothetical protein K0S33_3263 [Bacteroidetes bacterium]|jgi:hypothetical protein|nr:hypothetical protein [Bacteroidota bacterium]